MACIRREGDVEEEEEGTLVVDQFCGSPLVTTVVTHNVFIGAYSFSFY